MTDTLASNTTWTFNDGGRSAAGFKGQTGDCVTRAIAIASGTDYRTVYNDLMDLARIYAANHRDRTARLIRQSGPSPRNGVFRKVYEPYLTDTLGFEWVPTMQIGSGCIMHARADELPRDEGLLILQLSRHLTVFDGETGEFIDSHDPTRQGTRCVYGYYRP